MNYASKALLVSIVCFSASLAYSQEGPKFSYKENITVKVGQSVYIHAIRGDCGVKPSKKQLQLPAALNGKLSLGELGWRNSNRCGGPTPAVGVVYTATKKGKELLFIDSDPVNVTVK